MIYGLIPYIDDGISIIRELANQLSVNAVELLLEIHPIFLKLDKSKNYQIITGEPQLRLARALLGAKARITVHVLIDDKDSKFAELVAELIAPLILSTKEKELRMLAESAIKNPDVLRIGRNLDISATWDSLLNALHQKRPYNRKAKIDASISQESAQSVDSTQSISESGFVAPTPTKTV